MLVGYMRVSKADGSQTADLQRDALLAAGVEVARLYEDHNSGESDDRPGLVACLKAVRDGDTLAVWKLDRLVRNLHHLVTTVHDLTGRGVGLEVLTGQCRDRHHRAGGQTGLRDLRCPVRVRTGSDLRAHYCRVGLGSCSRPQGRTKMTPAKVRLAAASMGQPDTQVNELCAELG